MKNAIGIAIAVVLATICASQSASIARPTAQISGQAVDATTLAPIWGIHVLAVVAGTKTVEAQAETGKDGRFTLRGLAGGQYRLVFDRSGFGQAYADGISVQPDDHLVLISPFAVARVPLSASERVSMLPRCGGVVEPSETADVYVVCSGQ